MRAALLLSPWVVPVVLLLLTHGTHARSNAQLARLGSRQGGQAGPQQLQDVGRVFKMRTARMERRQAVTVAFSGPRTSSSSAAMAPISSATSISSFITFPSSSSSSSVAPLPTAAPPASSPPVSTTPPVVATPETTPHLSTIQQLFADLPSAVLLGSDVMDLPGPASGVPALIPGLVALLIVLSLWVTRKKLSCPFAVILISNVFLTAAALTLLISATRGPSTLAALFCSASTVTRFVWLALAAKALFKARQTQAQRSAVPRPELFGFSSSSSPTSSDEVQRSRYAVVRVVVWTLVLALGVFEPAWRLALALSTRKLTEGLMCTASVLQALLIIVLVAAIASSANAAPQDAKWRRRGAVVAIPASTIAFAVAMASIGLHGFSEAPLGRLLLLCENLLYLAAATMLALPFEHRNGMRRNLSLRGSCTAPPPYHRSMSEKSKERPAPPPKTPQRTVDGAAPSNDTAKRSTMLSVKRKPKPEDVIIEPFIFPRPAHAIEVSLSAPTSPIVTTSANVTQDRPELMRSVSSPIGQACTTLSAGACDSADTQLTILRPASALTATSDERHANSAIIVAAAPSPAPSRDIARMVSLSRGRSKGGRSIATTVDSARYSLPPPLPSKQAGIVRSSVVSSHSTVESSRGACGEDILDHFPTPLPSSYAGGMPDSVRNSGVSEANRAAYAREDERVELSYAQGEDEIYVLPEAPGLRRSSSRTHVSVTSFMANLAARSGLSTLRQAHTPSSLSTAPSSDAIHAPTSSAAPVPSSPALIVEPTSDGADPADAQYSTSPPRTLLLLPEVTLANSDTSSMYVDDSGVWDVPVSPGLARSRGGSGRSSLVGEPADSPAGSTKADLGHAHANASSVQLLTPAGWKRTSIPTAASPLRRSFGDNGAVSDDEDDEAQAQRSSLYMTPRNSVRTPLGWTKEEE